MDFFVFVAILALSAALLELAFQWFMCPDMVFYPWAVLLSKLAHTNEVWRHITRVLGRCRFCNGTWIGIYMYLYYFELDLRILIMIGYTFFFIKVFSDYILKDIKPNKEVDELLGYDTKNVTHTPVKPMLWAYLFIILFYTTVYILIPVIISLFK